jgi:2-oxoglutarate ferredoxin oxidoreductase subunit gamma
MKKRTEVKICGFGGQGIVLSGYIIGKAASLHDGKEAVLTQSYGPEARGGACSADIVISEVKVDYPYLKGIDILVVMSQEAYSTYSKGLADDVLMLIDEDLVEPLDINEKIELHKIPATRIAEELGNKIVANIVMLGFFSAVTGVVGRDAMKKAVMSTVPKGTLELNEKAFDRGFEYGKGP